jgi:hypothetical protein
LTNILGLGPTGTLLFRPMLELARHLLQEEIKGQPLLNNMEKVANYCHAAMAHLEIEQFCILLLNRRGVHDGSIVALLLVHRTSYGLTYQVAVLISAVYLKNCTLH